MLSNVSATASSPLIASASAAEAGRASPNGDQASKQPKLLTPTQLLQQVRKCLFIIGCGQQLLTCHGLPSPDSGTRAQAHAQQAGAARSPSVQSLGESAVPAVDRGAPPRILSRPGSGPPSQPALAPASASTSSSSQPAANAAAAAGNSSSSSPAPTAETSTIPHAQPAIEADVSAMVTEQLNMIQKKFMTHVSLSYRELLKVRRSGCRANNFCPSAIALL